MLPQQLKLSDITDERTAQLYIDQIVMVAFCRVQVAAAHLDGQCPCDWSPSPADIETMRVALGGASTQVRRDDLQSMAVPGRA